MLSDLKVLELASVLAGPSVGQFFAELGADVIKVENPSTGGDVTRSWKTEDERLDDRSSYFCCCNWGKKSVALDLTRKTDLGLLYKLVLKTDVVIASYKPGDAEKLGVDYKALSAINPGLIYGQITGYGPGDDRVGYDAVIQAEAGFMDLNGEKDGPPSKMPVALIDILAAHHLKEGLLLALMNRLKSGTGCFIEVSLLQAAISSLTNQATNWLVGSKLPVRQGSSHPNISPYGDFFETSDGKRILLAVGNDKQFRNLCEVLDIRLEDFGEIFSSNTNRVKNRQALNGILKDRIERRDSVELFRILNKNKIPAGLIQNIREVFEMEQARQIMIRGGGLSGVRNLVIKSEGLADFSVSNILPPPKLGEHTLEILSKIK